MHFRRAQRQQNRQGMVFAINLARLLQLGDREFARFLAEIEGDPLFKKLAWPGAAGTRAIRYRRFARTALSRRFLEMKEDLVACRDAGGQNVEAILEEKRKLVDSLRRIGEERFKKYFLDGEGPISPDEIARECGLTAAEVGEIVDLLNTIHLGEEFGVSASPAFPQRPYRKIAIIVPEKAGGYELHFTSFHWIRGTFAVDYDLIERLKREGRFTAAEKKRLLPLLRKIEQANTRKSVIVNALRKIVDRQKEYLDSGGAGELAPCSQKELAAELGVHPSTVNRAVGGRFVELPWGAEMAVQELLPKAGKRDHDLEGKLREVMAREKRRLGEGSIRRPYGDDRIAAILRSEYALRIAPRTVTKYRALLHIPNAFHRKPLR